MKKLRWFRQGSNPGRKIGRAAAYASTVAISIALGRAVFFYRMLPYACNSLICSSKLVRGRAVFFCKFRGRRPGRVFLASCFSTLQHVLVTLKTARLQRPQLRVLFWEGFSLNDRSFCVCKSLKVCSRY